MTVQEIQRIIKEKIPEGLIAPEHNDSGHFYRQNIVDEKYPSVTTKCTILEQPHLKVWSAKLAVEYIIRKLDIERMVPGAIIPFNPGRILELKESAILAHKDEFESAGDIGTRGHKVIEEYLIEWMKTNVRPADIRTFVKDQDSRIFAIARSAEMFCKDFCAIPIVSEMLVASTKYKFAGTLDSLMMVLRTTEKGDNPNCEHEFLRMSGSRWEKVKCLHCGRAGEYEFALVDWKSSNAIFGKVEYAMQASAYWQALKEMTGLRPKRIYIVRLEKTQAKYEVGVIYHRPTCFKAFLHCSWLYDWLENGTEKLIKANPREQVEINSNNKKDNDNNINVGTGIEFVKI